MKAAAAGPPRGRDNRPCLPFTRTVFFFFLSSQQLLSRGSHTPKPRAFNRVHEVGQWLTTIPWSVPSQAVLVSRRGTMEVVCDLMR